MLDQFNEIDRHDKNRKLHNITGSLHPSDEYYRSKKLNEIFSRQFIGGTNFSSLIIINPLSYTHRGHRGLQISSIPQIIYREAASTSSTIYSGRRDTNF